MNNELERQLIEIIAVDRIDRPISSMSGKLKRRKPKLAQAVELAKKYDGERVWARVDNSDREKARGMKEGIEKFEENFPKYGRILNGYIEEQRTLREKHLVFGMQDGCRITSQDYMGVMTDLGFTEATARGLYTELMDISRNMARKRDETERSILIDTKI